MDASVRTLRNKMEQICVEYDEYINMLLTELCDAEIECFDDYHQKLMKTNELKTDLDKDYMEQRAIDELDEKLRTLHINIEKKIDKALKFKKASLIYCKQQHFKKKLPMRNLNTMNNHNNDKNDNDDDEDKRKLIKKQSNV